MPAITPSSRYCLRPFLQLLTRHIRRSSLAICILCTLPRRIAAFQTTNKAFHFDAVLPVLGGAGSEACVFTQREAVCLAVGGANRQLNESKVQIGFGLAVSNFLFFFSCSVVVLEITRKREV